MKFRLLAALVCASALAVTAPVVHAADDDDDLSQLQQRLGNEWFLVKNDRLRNIKTWIKQEDGKRFRSFKVEATLDGTIASFVHILLDFDNYQKWYWEVLDSKLVRKTSATEYVMYIKHRAPYGVPNRDTYNRISIEPQTANRTLTVRVKAIPEFGPEAPPLIRMLAEDMTVRLTPNGANSITIEAEGYVDPGGKAPNWATNFIQRSAPYSIIIGLQRMLGHQQYAARKEPLPFPVYESAN
jgi:hypothetical protein